MVTARRQKGSALRQPSRRPQASSATWPPSTGEGQPWYVDDWRFGEGPSPEAAAAADEARRTQVRIGVAVVATVIAVVVVVALFLLL